MISCAYGLMQGTGALLAQTLLLTLSPVEMRGRVMGMRSFVILALSLGSIMSGAIAEQFSAPVAGKINGALCIVLILAVAIMVPSLRRSQREV